MMITILLGAMGMMSLLSFCLMGIDKGRAKRGAWRISEKTLLCAAALFGAPGCTRSATRRSILDSRLDCP